MVPQTAKLQVALCFKMYQLKSHLENLAPLVQVKDTGTAYGNGAFAMSEILHGAYLGDYEGELLDLEEYYARHPTGTVRSSSVASSSSYCCYSVESSCSSSNHVRCTNLGPPSPTLAPLNRTY